jgi:tetratricopeptide (TPR) repeat protein
MSKNLEHCTASWTCRIAMAIPLFASSPALAQTPTAPNPAPSVLQAEDYAAHAFEAYGRKEYGEAVALYQRAYDRAPSAAALYNIARVYDLGLRDRPLAIAAYRRYLSDAGATPDHIQVANDRLALLREAELVVNAAEQNAPRPLVPAAPRPVSATLAQSGSEAGQDWSALRVAGAVTGAAGLVSLAVGVGSGLLVLKDADTANQLCVKNRCSSQRGVDAARSASTHATVATVGVSVGLGLMATGAVLWLASGRSREQPSATSLQVVPLTTTSELGLSLAGNW